METLQNGRQTQLLKNVQIHSHCMHINIFSQLVEAWCYLHIDQGFLYFIVLFAFYACKKDTSNISNRHKTEPYITILQIPWEK